MSRVHYFQRYSQKENMVTNNTLLLLNRLNMESTYKFNQLINFLLEDYELTLDSEIKFIQQEKGNKSIPDGVIRQHSFKIIIETKLYGQEHKSQLVNHFEHFNNEDQQLLIWLNKSKITNEYYRDIKDEIKILNERSGKKVVILPITFKDIIKAFNEVLEDYDREMIEVINDYELFIREMNLIDNFCSIIRVVSVGQSIELNYKYDMYYFPTDRSYRDTKFLGLYKNKKICAVGELYKFVDLEPDYVNGTFDIRENNLTEEELTKVKEMAVEAYNDHRHVEKGYFTRFVLVKKFYECDFTKKSKYGIRGQRYLDVEDFIEFNEYMSAEQVSELLNDKEWE